MPAADIVYQFAYVHLPVYLFATFVQRYYFFDKRRSIIHYFGVCRNASAAVVYGCYHRMKQLTTCTADAEPDDDAPIIYKVSESFSFSIRLTSASAVSTIVS
jgi:hypothetical protein